MLALASGCAVQEGTDHAGNAQPLPRDLVMMPHDTAALEGVRTHVEMNAPASAVCTPKATPSVVPMGWREMDFTGQEWAYGARVGHSAVWDGREMLVFGGGTPETASYDPNQDRWTKLPASGLAARAHQLATWTGHEMIVVGGSSKDGVAFDDGARFDPCASTWKPIARATSAIPDGATAVWATTTHEMIVVGNGVALAYRADVDAWRTLAASPLGKGAKPIATWIGESMIVYAGGAAASYDPARDVWSSLPSAPSTAPRGEVAIATGNGATFFGGPTDKTTFDGTYTGYFAMNGVTYDALRSAWANVPAPAADVLSERSHAMTFWGNGKLFVWGGHVINADRYIHTAEDGATFDPTTGAWTKLPRATVYAMREDASVVWTGTEAIFLGGVSSCTMGNPTPFGGEVFRP